MWTVDVLYISILHRVISRTISFNKTRNVCFGSTAVLQVLYSIRAQYVFWTYLTVLYSAVGSRYTLCRDENARRGKKKIFLFQCDKHFQFQSKPFTCLFILYVTYGLFYSACVKQTPQDNAKTCTTREQIFQQRVFSNIFDNIRSERNA